MGSKKLGIGSMILLLVLAGAGCGMSPRPKAAGPEDDVGHGPRFETENMTLTGGDRLLAPFDGVALYSNGDSVSADYHFPEEGRYVFEVAGASSNSSPAGVTAYVGEVAGTTAFFDAPTRQVKTVFVDVESAGVHRAALKLTSDIGENNTYLDAVTIQRHGPLTAPPAPPTTGAFASGVYRNMFLERGYPDEAIAAKVTKTYEQLFHGDINNEAILFDAGGNHLGKLAYIADISNDDVRSEGMSYGMMIAVQMDRKEDFDALWNWARTYMYQDDPSHPCYGYFAWQMGKDGRPMDEMPAPDGEEYFITALFFAAHRWGDGEGLYAYSTHAQELLDRFKNRGPITGEKLGSDGVRETTGVALIHPEHKMVRFTPDRANFAVNGDHTNPSYHLPAFYELWALWGPPEDRGFWQAAAHASRAFFHKAAHPETGLTPDYAAFDGAPVSASFNQGSDNFRWDAWRTAMNWGMDHHWFAKDERQRALTDRLQAFFAAEGIATHRQLYRLDGAPFGGEDGKWHAIGLAAANGVASLAATHAVGWRFVDAVWGSPVPTGTYRYYDGALLMLSLLHLSGNFRIYGPDQTEAAAAGSSPAPQRAVTAPAS